MKVERGEMRGRKLKSKKNEGRTSGPKDGRKAKKKKKEMQESQKEQ